MKVESVKVESSKEDSVKEDSVREENLNKDAVDNDNLKEKDVEERDDDEDNKKKDKQKKVKKEQAPSESDGCNKNQKDWKKDDEDDDKRGSGGGAQSSGGDGTLSPSHSSGNKTSPQSSRSKATPRSSGKKRRKKRKKKNKQQTKEVGEEKKTARASNANTTKYSSDNVTPSRMTMREGEKSEGYGQNDDDLETALEVSKLIEKLENWKVLYIAHLKMESETRGSSERRRADHSRKAEAIWLDAFEVLDHFKDLAPIPFKDYLLSQPDWFTKTYEVDVQQRDNMLGTLFVDFRDD